MATRILYIGPKSFSGSTGEKNVDIIFPSLFAAIPGGSFHIVHGREKLPDYALKLRERFDVTFHQALGGSSLAWLQTIWRLTWKYRFDVITNVFFGFNLGLFGAIIARLAGCRSVVRFAANELEVRRLSGFYRGLVGRPRYLRDAFGEKLAVNLAHQVLAMSPWEEDRLRRMAFSSAKVIWCMRGIDLKLFSPPAFPASCPRRVLYVGRNAPEKGIHLLEQAAKSMENAYPGLEFHFVGTFENSIHGNRRYHSYVHPDKMREVYLSADIFVLPSASEGFANVLVEAMSLGRCCLVDKQLHKGFFRDGEEVMFINGTSGSIEEKLRCLLDTPGMARSIGICARAFAERHYDAKVWQRKYRAAVLGNTA